MALYRAVRVFHRDGEQAAFDSLEADTAALQAPSALYLDYLAHYVDSYQTQGNTAFQFPLRVDLDLGRGISLGGEIGRIDLVPGDGYAAWLLRPTPKPRKWQSHLNMPILQKVVADALGTAVQEVSIGYYWFGPDEYSANTYSPQEVAAAMQEVRRLAEAMAQRLT